MILRKPYAFLIKYFRRINILLLLLVGFVFYKNQQLYQFVNNYLNTGVYNSVINSIDNYTGIYVYLAFIIILIISGILIYLLRYKDKPFASYVYILVANFITFCFFLYADNYFTYDALNGFNLVATKVIKDLLFISTLPYYPILFILIIRSIGIDLKSFGFQEDKEFVEINEQDREEVEVEVGFDKDRFIRKIKNRIRYSKYFFLEHKVSLSIVFVLVLAIFGFNFYHYFYVENRIYNMNEPFKSNNFDITVNNSYLTDKDYAGNIVSEEGTYFILIDITVNNLLSSSRNFDIEKMLLFVDNDYYVPTTKFNSYFQDMGNLYINKSIKGKEKTSYLLVYEIPKLKEGANIILKCQDWNIQSSKLMQVKIKVLDISTFKEKGVSNLGNEFNVPLNLEENVSFKLSKYQILDNINYTYQQCGPNSCPIYEKNVVAPSGYKILYLKGSFGEYTNMEFINFLKKYAMISYSTNGQKIEKKLDFAVNKDYFGNHIYLLINDEIANADSISLVFTVRTYKYYYVIK